MTLYEACTGCDRREFPALPENVAELPDHADLLQLIRVINRACQPDRRKRYQSAAELRLDVEKLLAGRGLGAATRRGAIALPVTLCILGVSVASWLWNERRNRPPPDSKADASATAPAPTSSPPILTVRDPRSGPSEGETTNGPTVPRPVETPGLPGESSVKETTAPRGPSPRRVAPASSPVVFVNPKEKALADAKARLDAAKAEWNRATAERANAEARASRGRRAARREAQASLPLLKVTESRALEVLNQARRDYDRTQQEHEIFRRSQLPR